MSKSMTFQEAMAVVKGSLDILDVVGRHVSLKRTGRNYSGLCPFHQEKTPSFSVNAEKQMFKCFGCGEGGDALSFLMKKEQKSFGELIVELAADQDIEILSDHRSQVPHLSKTERDVMLDLQTLARQFFEIQLAGADSIQTYLAERQVTPSWQQHFGIGYAPGGWENLTTYLSQHSEAVKNNPRLLEKAGLANTRSEGQGYYDRFRNRLMIPIQDDRGRVVAFGGRSLDPEDMPKYMNSPETPVYTKSNVLYGLCYAKEAMREAGYAILMEGYFDVIAAHMAGIPQAVGVCGTALTENQLKLITRLGVQQLYLCFDSDDAGKTAALRAIELIENQLLEQGTRLNVIQLPDAKDPDEFLKTHGKDAFLAQMKASPDFLLFKFNQALDKIPTVHTPEGRIQGVHAVTPMLLRIRQPVIRQEYIKLLSERLHIAEETLQLELKRAEGNNTAYGYKKNYATDAIFNLPDRYRGSNESQYTRGRNAKPARRRPEDTTVFHNHIAPKTRLEEKENLLLGYLLLNEEGYTTVMSYLETLNLKTPLATAFLETVRQVQNQWETVSELIQVLSAQFHADENHDMLQYLADRAVEHDALNQIMERSAKGLKSLADRGKLCREVDAVVKNIINLQCQTALNTLAQDGKQSEAVADDQSALAVQQQLREQLKARKTTTLLQTTPAGVAASDLSAEQQQGV